MKITYLVNSFSINMIRDDVRIIERTHMDVEDVQNEIKNSTIISAVGHHDLTVILSDIVGEAIEFNRQTLSLGIGDRLIVAQYRGVRLPEGCTVLPNNSQIKFYLLEFR